MAINKFINPIRPKPSISISCYNQKLVYCILEYGKRPNKFDFSGFGGKFGNTS